MSSPATMSSNGWSGIPRRRIVSPSSANFASALSPSTARRSSASIPCSRARIRSGVSPGAGTSTASSASRANA
jgi:hypothetical protein